MEYTYKIEGRQVYPYNHREIKLIDEEMDGLLYYHKKLDKEITLVNLSKEGITDYDFLVSIRDGTHVSLTETDLLEFIIYEDGTEFWKGEFSIYDCKFDNSLFNRVTFKPEAKDQYKNIHVGLKEKYNIIGDISSGTKIDVRLQETSIPGCGSYGTGIPPAPPSGYTTCTDMTTIEDLCGRTGTPTSWTHYRRIMRYKINNNYDYEYDFRYIRETCMAETVTIDHEGTGILLKDVIEYLVGEMDSSLSVVSQFLWNDPDENGGYRTDNYVTGTDPNPLQYLVVMQSSDWLDHDASEKATVGETSLNEILEMLATYFNCYPYIDNDGNYRIEHITKIKWELGANLTTTDWLTDEDGNDIDLDYNYDNFEVLTREEFEGGEADKWYFAPTSIEYVNKLTQGQANVKTRRASKFCVDIPYTFNKPDQISKNGFMLLHTWPSGGRYEVQNEVVDAAAGGAGYSLPNGHLTWINLIYRYHDHRRPFPTGLIDKTYNKTFASVKRFKKQVPIEIPASISIDPMKLVKTNLGNGEVEKIEHFIEQNKKIVTLLYD